MDSVSAVFHFQFTFGVGGDLAGQSIQLTSNALPDNGVPWRQVNDFGTDWTLKNKCCAGDWKCRQPTLRILTFPAKFQKFATNQIQQDLIPIEIASLGTNTVLFRSI